MAWHPYLPSNTSESQVRENTLVVGVDIGSVTNFARAFDWRGMEVTRKVFRFNNDAEGFVAFIDWMSELQQKNVKMHAIVGCEPTGHYWFPLARCLKKKNIKLVTVNPYHVKQLKELDDNSPKKTDLKDPKTIAKLVVEWRWQEPYLPEGIYADLREAVSSRERIQKELNAVSNRIQRWLTIYFPEYLKVYKNFDSESGLLVLERALLPEDVIAFGAQGVCMLWREKKLRTDIIRPNQMSAA